MSANQSIPMMTLDPGISDTKIIWRVIPLKPELCTASSEGFAKLVDKVTDRLAESAPDAFNQIYMQKIAANMEREQQQIRDFYQQLEETIIGEL